MMLNNFSISQIKQRSENLYICIKSSNLRKILHKGVVQKILREYVRQNKNYINIHISNNEQKIDEIIKTLKDL